MRYWLDTEFIEDGKTIELLSIGVVAEDGRELYLEDGQVDLTRASDWVRVNVVPHLHFPTCDRGYPATSCATSSRTAIKMALLDFCDPQRYGRPEFWGYYADYDWVVLCQLFGTMMDLPKGWPMYCRDVKQWTDALGNPTLPVQGKGEHYALADARWTREAWCFLEEYERMAEGDHADPA